MLAWTLGITGCSTSSNPAPLQPTPLKTQQIAPKIDTTPTASRSTTVSILAEDNAQVAVIDVTRSTRFTSLRLQAQAMLSSVCWAATGADSPYLEANGQRYRFLGGDNITTCPTERKYDERDEMVLRFEPLDPQAQRVSLIEGKGGEDQMLARPSRSGRRFWNFLDIPLN